MPHTALATACTSIHTPLGRVAPVSLELCHGMDETMIDISDPEVLTITQLTEFGGVHSIALCPKMADQALQLLLRWKISNTP